MGTWRLMIGRRGIAPARMLGLHMRAAKARRIASRAVYGDPGEVRAAWFLRSGGREIRGERVEERVEASRCAVPLEGQLDDPLWAVREPQAGA